MGDGREKHDAADKLWIVERHAQRHRAAIGVSNDDGFLIGRKRFKNTCHLGSLNGQRLCSFRATRIAMARPVSHQDAEILLQARGQREGELSRIGRGTVDHQHGRAVAAGSDDMNRHAVYLDELANRRVLFLDIVCVDSAVYARADAAKREQNKKAEQDNFQSPCPFCCRMRRDCAARATSSVGWIFSASW